MYVCCSNKNHCFRYLQKWLQQAYICLGQSDWAWGSQVAYDIWWIGTWLLPSSTTFGSQYSQTTSYSILLLVQNIFFAHILVCIFLCKCRYVPFDSTVRFGPFHKSLQQGSITSNSAGKNSLLKTHSSSGSPFYSLPLWRCLIRWKWNMRVINIKVGFLCLMKSHYHGHIQRKVWVLLRGNILWSLMSLFTVKLLHKKHFYIWIVRQMKGCSHVDLIAARWCEHVC